MKRHIIPLMMLLAGVIVLTSCSKDDDTITPNDNCYISSFSLVTLKKVVYGKTTAGGSNIYTSTYAGNSFPLTIDQRALTIENLDSLPVHTLTNKVLTKAAFHGYMYWRKHGYTGPDNEGWTAYNSADTLDLSEDTDFRVTATNGLSSRIYTLKLNVHQQRGDSTVWNNLGEVTSLTGIGQRKVLVWNDKLTILGKDGSGNVTCIQHPTETSGTWSSTSTNAPATADVTSIQSIGDKLYLSTSDGNILESTDAQTWTTAAYPTLAGLTLAGATEKRLYALAGGKLYSSDGSTWDEETLDEGEEEKLPTGNLNSAFYTLSNGSPFLILIGTPGNTEENTAAVWAKTWEDENETKGTWMYYVPNEADKFRCPMFENLCVVRYDDGLQALGGKSSDGRYAALSAILHSQDNGVTWKTYDNDDMVVDPELRSAAKEAQYISATVDSKKFMWIVVDNKVWRGRINRLGFLRQDR